MNLAVFLPDIQTMPYFEKQKYEALKSVYSSLTQDEIHFYDIPENPSGASLAKLLVELEQKKISKIIFLPFRDYAFVFVQELLTLLPQDFGFIFHLDGNFIFDSIAWSDLEKYLKHKSVKFICASKSQQALVQRFMESSSKVELLQPYLNLADTEVCQAKIEKLRLSHGVESDELVFLCSGPMQRQRYTLELSKVFLKLTEQLNIKVHLWLLGEFDDTGIPLVGKTQLPFEYYQQWTDLKLLFHNNKRVKLFDPDGLNDISLYFQASDIAVNLSTADNEDFNYQALYSSLNGLPLILSSWGSHFEFAQMSSTNFISLNSTSPFHSPNMNLCAKEIMKISLQTKRLTPDQRIKLKNLAMKYFSVDASIKQLESILNSKDVFEKFNPLFDKVCRSFARNPYAPFVDASSFGAYNPLYKNVYEPYFS